MVIYRNICWFVGLHLLALAVILLWASQAPASGSQCQSLKSARYNNKTAHLKYVVRDGHRCWFSVASKARSRIATKRGPSYHASRKGVVAQDESESQNSLALQKGPVAELRNRFQQPVLSDLTVVDHFWISLRVLHTDNHCESQLVSVSFQPDPAHFQWGWYLDVRNGDPNWDGH
jgi:hypothetical protein